MSHATRRPRKTLTDYLALPDDVRAELIDGEIYVTPAPTPHHQQVTARLWMHLDRWLSVGERGAAFVAPVDVRLPTGDLAQPDVLVVLTAHRALVRPDGVHGAPDLAVEVVSPSRPERDRFVKRHLYARNAVPEYWIVDPEERTAEVLRCAAGVYGPAGFFRAGDTLVSKTFEGLAISLADLFAPPFPAL